MLLSAKTDFDDCNLYAYCDNNPISRLDETGDVWQAGVSRWMGYLEKVMLGIQLVRWY